MRQILKVVAIVGLLFWGYCIWRINATWQHRDTLNKTIWWVFLGLLGGLCIGLLGRWSWIPIAGLLLVILTISGAWLVRLLFRP